MQKKECGELQEAIEYRNETPERLMPMMERKPKLVGEVPELRETRCPEIRASDDRISAEELDLLEK